MVRRALAVIAACTLAGGVSPGRAAEAVAPAISPVRVGYAAALVAEMAVPPDFLWAELKRMYVQGGKFSDQGFTVEELRGEAAAWLGGTIISKVEQGRLDRRVARFTAIDDTRRLLALEADYAVGLSVAASYEVTPTPGGCAFHLIAHVHSNERIEHAGELRPVDVQQHVRRVVAATEAELLAEWKKEKVRIEGRYREAAARSSVVLPSPAGEAATTRQ